MCLGFVVLFLVLVHREKPFLIPGRVCVFIVSVQAVRNQAKIDFFSLLLRLTMTTIDKKYLFEICLDNRLTCVLTRVSYRIEILVGKNQHVELLPLRYTRDSHHGNFLAAISFDRVGALIVAFCSDRRNGVYHTCMAAFYFFSSSLSNQSFQ